MKDVYFILIFLLFVFACQNSTKQNPKLYAYTNDLKIRDAASVNSNIIGYLQKSNSANYLDEKGDTLIALIEGNLLFEQWLRVETDSGLVGWVFSGGLDFDSTETNYGIFDTTNVVTDSVLFVPDKKTIPVYKLPQLSSEKLYEIEGLREISIEGEDTIVCPITGIKRVWIKSTDEKGNPLYILKSNLRKNVSNEISLEEFKKILINKYDVIEADEGFEFKSLKRFENGDDGAEWTEESELTFDFEGKYIKMGYMYAYTSIEMKRIIKNGNRYTFGVKSGYSLNNKEFEIVLNNGFIKVNNAGELSVKYVPGKADNY